MRNPQVVLDNLVRQSKVEGYMFERLYRNLYNPEFYLMAYSKIYHKEGNMTSGTDGQTIDGFNMKKIESLIELMKTQSYSPEPARRTYIPKKNGGKRPLGIPFFYDKLVQEVLRTILESIYNSTFSEHSHGFRPNTSCHTALTEIAHTFTGAKWFIEGDIKGFFDNIDHHILINIIRRKIKDEKFLNLIWKFLKAGYLEEWKFHNTYSGTPQGGIISPILSNIYLNELDKFMEKYKISFDIGNKRTINPEYKAIQHQIRKRRRWLEKGRFPTATGKSNVWKELDASSKEKILSELRELEKRLINTPYTDPMDKTYKRLQYVRYADDFLVGVIGNKEDARKIKQDIKNFLAEELKIELSVEKTLITNSRDFAKFLGYEITIVRNQKAKRDKNGTSKRYNHGKVGLYVPYENWRNKLLQLNAMKITKDVNNKEKWVPTHRTYLKDNDDLEILMKYNSEIRGLYNYYKLANNASVLGKFKYIMEYSMYKTLANKYKTSVPKIIKKYNINGTFGIKYETSKGPKVAYLYDKGFKRQQTLTIESEIDVMPTPNKYLGRTSLIDRLNARKCEWCGKEDVEIHIHHVRKLKELKGKAKWEQLMIARRRKTLALCKQCHVDLHSGRLD